jgi:hypothetical protein
MITRKLTNKLLQLAAYCPVVAVTGPRQAGKIMLCKATFPDKPYMLLITVRFRNNVTLQLSINGKDCLCSSLLPGWQDTRMTQKYFFIDFPQGWQSRIFRQDVSSLEDPADGGFTSGPRPVRPVGIGWPSPQGRPGSAAEYLKIRFVLRPGPR